MKTSLTQVFDRCFNETKTSKKLANIETNVILKAELEIGHKSNR